MTVTGIVEFDGDIIGMAGVEPQLFLEENAGILLPPVSHCLGQWFRRRSSEGSGDRGLFSPTKVARGGAREERITRPRALQKKCWLTTMPRTGHSGFEVFARGW